VGSISTSTQERMQSYIHLCQSHHVYTCKNTCSSKYCIRDTISVRVNSPVLFAISLDNVYLMFGRNLCYIVVNVQILQLTSVSSIIILLSIFLLLGLFGGRNRRGRRGRGCEHRLADGGDKLHLGRFSISIFPCYIFSIGFLFFLGEIVIFQGSLL
jgi:hypothetical protein